MRTGTYIPDMPRPDSNDPVVSMVVPLFNEAGNVEPLAGALEAQLNKLDFEWEVILVDDGSSDATWEEIGRAVEASPRFRGLSFTRNFGKDKALLAGMSHARGQAIVTMDGDLQHPPAAIGELVAAWRQGHRIVHTRRHTAEGTSLFRRLTSRLFYRIFSALSGIALSAGSSDFRLVDREVMGALDQMRDSGSFLRGLMQWTGYESTTVDYQAQERHTGESKYPKFGLIGVAGNAILSFSVIPLKMGIWVGLFTSFLAVIEIIYVVNRYLAGATVPGWASLACIISFMFGVLFILVGIIGAYIGHIFEIVKNRPPYLIEREIGFKDE
jgi:glycosyltransferase involved in cell wall biosynthesis